MDGNRGDKKNNNEFMSTKMQSGTKIRATSDGSYHPTYQYRTSAWIIKIQNNDCVFTGENVFPGDAKYQCFTRSELCGLIGDIRHIIVFQHIQRSLRISRSRMRCIRGLQGGNRGSGPNFATFSNSAYCCFCSIIVHLGD